MSPSARDRLAISQSALMELFTAAERAATAHAPSEAQHTGGVDVAATRDAMSTLTPATAARAVAMQRAALGVTALAFPDVPQQVPIERLHKLRYGLALPTGFTPSTMVSSVRERDHK